MKVLDLFSGIGGFSLGLERAGMETVAFCEYDKKAQLVLKKHWPGVPIYDDVRELTGEQIAEEIGAVDLICGGFPCQPFSFAGKQRGHRDDRDLWPEYFRLIQEIRPRWVIGENVPGFINKEMGLPRTVSNLEGEGYKIQCFNIPACAVNAPHRRDRVWIVAYADKCPSGYSKQGSLGGDGKRQPETKIGTSEATKVTGPSKTQRSMPNSHGPGWKKQRQSVTIQAKQSAIKRDSQDMGDPTSGELPDWAGGTMGQPCPVTEFERPGGREIELSVCVLFDGLPSRLVRPLKFSSNHSIMGLIISTMEACYEKESRYKEVSLLLKDHGSEEVREKAGRLYCLYKEEVLQCNVHGEKTNETGPVLLSPLKEMYGEEEGTLPKLQNQEKPSHSSYRSKPEKQCSCQFNDLVCILSLKMALGERENNVEKEQKMFNLWKTTCKGEELLPEPLQVFCEIWRTLFDDEIRSFQGVFDHRGFAVKTVHGISGRVNRLKQLGNAVVPQIVEIIGRTIMQVEQE